VVSSEDSSYRYPGNNEDADWYAKFEPFVADPPGFGICRCYIA
jgi:hypothetical protein